ncbi:MAG: hypothetical protein QW404_03165 [Candidatus Nanoarchaeia archaeon]
MEIKKNGFTLVEFLFVVAILIIVLVLVVPRLRHKGGTSEDAELQKFKTPIWSKDVLEMQDRAVLTYKHEIRMKPPFYKGSMPLSFIAGKVIIGYQHEMANVYCKFEDFVNLFIYVDPAYKFHGIAQGAVTLDSSGKLLAEAKLLKMVIEEGKPVQGFELEEFHYGKDGLVFRCKSLIEANTGFKQKEYEAVGKKKRDYYFVWPVGGPFF